MESTEPVRNPPRGLGGWLILLLLGIWIDAASRLAAGVSAWAGMLHLAHIPDIPALRPVPATIAVAAGLLGAIAGYCIATKQSKGPAIAKSLLALEAGYYLLSVLAAVLHNGPVVADSLPGWVKPGGYLAAYCVGLAYLLGSRRIANTWYAQPAQANPSEMFQNDESSSILRTRIFPWEEVNTETPAEPAPQDFDIEPVSTEEPGQSEFDALKAQITEGVLLWLTSTANNPASHPAAHAALLAEAGTSSIEEITLKLLDQVIAICDHVWSVHTGQSPTLPNTSDSGGSLSNELQKWAIAQAAFRLTRSLDIRAALEANGPFEKLARDHEYLMAIVQKNSSEDAFGRKVDLADYQGHTGPEIAYKLILKAQRDMFEADMWAQVASLAGDPEFLSRFSSAGAKTFQDSLEYWRAQTTQQSEDQASPAVVGAFR